MTQQPHRPLSGAELRSAFVAAAAHLGESARAVDAINVYPVPDGDTGSNMSATLRQATDETLLLPADAAPSEVLAALARGALYGARGNSGVILSQALRGFAAACTPGAPFDARSFALALAGAAQDAYRAVSHPVEGTMLTVLSRAAEAAAGAASALPAGGAGCAPHAILRAVVLAAEQAEARTIEQLPALREAGVPDAGGEGICVILRGLEAALTGVAARLPALPGRPIAMMAGHEQGFGFCTEFLVEAADTPLDLDQLRALVTRPGAPSVVVVGDAQAARVHVHTLEPEALLAAAAEAGALSRVKVDDMTAQNVAFRETGGGATARAAVLALSHGPGLAEVFRGLGVAVAGLGFVVKPSSGDIAAAADALRKPDVIVLPNHKNVVPAARQAQALTTSTLHVIATETIPQGIAAALAFNPAASLTGNVAAMTTASASVRTVEVTTAAADRTADGVVAHRGESLALVDGRLVASLPDPIEALLAGLDASGAAGATLVTLYAGDGAAAALERAVPLAQARFPGVEVEGIDGGQPLYPFLASVEF